MSKPSGKPYDQVERDARMSDMVERVALAISGSDDHANVLDIHRNRARAAIEAMRVPTKEMEAPIWAAGSLAPEDVWPTMISIALGQST